jgi:hypothetical protein
MFSRASPIPQWVPDLHAGRSNEAALKFWRMTLDEFLSNKFAKFFHSEEMPR